MSSTTLRATIALLVLPAALSAQSALDTLNARPIALRDAVAMAQENGLSAIQTRGAVKNAVSAVRTARGALLPSLSISLSQTNTSGDQLDPITGVVTPRRATRPWNYSTGLSSSLNLFDGGRRLNEVKRARFDVSAAEANEVNTKYNLALQVKTQYYAILAAREAESAAQAQLEQANEQLKASIARTRAGVATLSDSLRSIIAVGNAQLALITARNNVRVASASLTRIIGSEALVTAQQSDTLDQGLAPVDSGFLAGLLDQGPQVKASEAQLESARSALKSAKTPYLPTVDLTFSHGGTANNQFYGLNGDNLAFSNSFGLRLSYNLFNNFTREDALSRAGVTADLAEASVRDIRAASRQTLVQQLAALRSAQQRILIQQTSLDAAKEDLRVQQQRYALGASTLLDVLTSQTALDAARSSLIQARQDVRVARAQLEALVGRDLP
ncbi:MAG: TolC family protein [Gemmatimonadota bacterium]